MSNSPRREFTAKTKQQALARSGGECEYMRDGVRCLVPLRAGQFVYDHIDPDWFSKDNELENCQVICALCRRDKDAKDQANISKSKRHQRTAIGIRSRKRKGRPMAGTKASGIRKRMNGTVERW